MKPNFKYELENESYSFVAGVDEVGRGSIAGPIVAGAVVFTDYKKSILKLKGVDDSKALTAKKRQELDVLIKKIASDFSIGVVSVEEIDLLGIGAANVVAFKRALDGLKECDFALIDGRRFRGFEYPYLCLEKGESKSLSIAAASIIAKVFRDNLMVEIAKDCEHYDFAGNKGYGCDQHYADLREFGLSKHHRKSFLKSLGDCQQSFFD